MEVPRLEPGELLSAVYVMYQGGPGHTSNPVGLSITVPRIDVYHVAADGTKTQLCWGPDNPHLPPAGYEQPHVISASGCSHNVDPSSGRIVLKVAGEFTDTVPGGFQEGGTVWSVRTLTY